jgi:hypothetical protein
MIQRLNCFVCGVWLVLAIGYVARDRAPLAVAGTVMCMVYGYLGFRKGRT